MSSPQVSDRARTDAGARPPSTGPVRFSPSFAGVTAAGILERDLESTAQARPKAGAEVRGQATSICDEAWCAPGVRRA